jgi:putative transposase
MLLSLVYAVVSTLLRLLLVRWRWLTADDVELLVLRHEQRRLRRRTSGAVWRPADRLCLAALGRRLPPGERHRLPVHPATLRRWHRELLERRWASHGRRRAPGRPPLAADLQALIVLWGRRIPSVIRRRARTRGGVRRARAASRSDR